MTDSIIGNRLNAGELKLSAKAEKKLALRDRTPENPLTLSDFRINFSATPLSNTQIERRFKLLSECADDGVITENSATRFLHRLTGEDSFGEKLWWNALSSDLKTFAREFVPAMTGWVSEAYEFAEGKSSSMQGGAHKGAAMLGLMGSRLLYTMTRDLVEGVKATRKIQSVAIRSGDPETNAHAFFMSSLLLSQLLIMRGMAKSLFKKPPTQKIFPKIVPAHAQSGAIAGTAGAAQFIPTPGGIGGVVFMKGTGGSGKKADSSSAKKQRTFEAPKLFRYGDKRGLFAHRGRRRYPAKKVGDHLEVQIGRMTYYYDLRGNRLGSNSHASVTSERGLIREVIIEGSEQKFRVSDEGMIAVEHGEKTYFFDRAGMRHPATHDDFLLTHFKGAPAIFRKGRPVDFELSGRNAFKLSLGDEKLFMDYEGSFGTIENPIFHLDRTGLKSIVIDGKPHAYEISSEGILVAVTEKRLVPYDIDGVRLIADRKNPYQLTVKDKMHLFFEDRMVNFTRCKDKLGYAIIDGKYELFWDGDIIPSEKNIAAMITKLDDTVFAVMNGERYEVAIAYSTYTKKVRSLGNSTKYTHIPLDKALISDRQGNLFELLKRKNMDGSHTISYKKSGGLYDPINGKFTGYAKDGLKYEIYAWGEDYVFLKNGEKKITIDRKNLGSRINPSEVWISEPELIH